MDRVQIHRFEGRIDRGEMYSGEIRGTIRYMAGEVAPAGMEVERFVCVRFCDRWRIEGDLSFELNCEVRAFRVDKEELWP